MGKYEVISFGFLFVYLLVDYITLSEINQGVSLVADQAAGKVCIGATPVQSFRKSPRATACQPYRFRREIKPKSLKSEGFI